MAKSRKSAGGAAALPGELALLSAVASHPLDDTVELVYADWWEEHGDPRGPFLREFVRAVRAGTDLPGGRGVPAAWQEMAGLSLIRRLCEGGLAAHVATVMALARPALAVEARPSSEGRIAV